MKSDSKIYRFFFGRRGETRMLFSVILLILVPFLIAGLYFQNRKYSALSANPEFTSTAISNIDTESHYWPGLDWDYNHILSFDLDGASWKDIINTIQKLLDKRPRSWLRNDFNICCGLLHRSASVRWCRIHCRWFFKDVKTACWEEITYIWHFGEWF